MAFIDRYRSIVALHRPPKKRFHGYSMFEQSVRVLAVSLMGISMAQASEFSGVWIGGKAGYNWNTPTTADTSDGVYPGAEAGYGWDVEGMVLGIDANADWHSRSVSGSAYGVEMKLGKPLDKYMPYAKLGTLVSSPGMRIQGGLGVEYVIASKWTVSGEWKFDNKYVDGVNQRNNNLTLGMNYYFDAARQPAKVAASPVIAPVAVMAPAVPAAAIAPVAAVQPIVAVPAPIASPVLAATGVQSEDLKNIKDNHNVTLSGANFDTASANLKPEALSTLDEVAKYALANSVARIEVSGHADKRPQSNVSFNLKLSKKRAESVKAYLVKKGVSAARIAAKGFGSTQPVASNESEEGRAKNRRVEIRFIAH